MNKKSILNKLMAVTQQPFFIFAKLMEEKPNSTFETLHFLATTNNVTAGMIAEYLDIKPSSVTTIINKLEDANMAIRVKSKEDARVTIIELTDEGRESVHARGTISMGLQDELLKGFNEQELANLGEYLNRMEENISSEEFFQKLEEIFGNDKNWQHFSKMSARFGRVREQMLERGGFGGFDRFGRGKDFQGHFGGFEGWKKGRNK